MTKIIRHVETYESVEVPEGYEVCSRCDGKGGSSKYDEGWHSLVHSPELAAFVECFACGGQGYTKDYTHNVWKDV